MNDKNQPHREDFVQELIVFNPEYNLVTAKDLADSLSDDEIEQFLTRLERINQKEADDLEDLRMKDPDAYENRMQARRAEEDANDTAYFDDAEKAMLAATEQIDARASELEAIVDKEADQAIKEIDDVVERNASLLKAFYEEVENREQDSKKPKTTEPVRSVEEVQKELKTASPQTDSPEKSKKTS